MNRRDFLRATGASAAALAATSNGLGAPTTKPAAATLPAVPFAIASAPVLLYPTPDAVTVAWSVTSAGTGWVEYGPTEALGLRADGDAGGLLPFADRFLSVRLAGLKPGTRYFYRVHAAPVNFKAAYSIHRGSAVCSTDVRSFTTPDPAASECRFTVWNDTHEVPETLAKLADTLAAAGPTDFLFWNGDIANAINTEDEIVSKYFAPTARPFADQVPVMFSRGNHDVRGRAARHLTRYLPFPGGEQTYFAFRQGPVAFFVLDTGEDKPDDHPAYAGLANFAAYREQQARWLESVVRQPSFAAAPFKVVFAHIPLVWDAPHHLSFTATYGEVRGWVCDDGFRRWGKTLADAHVDLVVSGHTHMHAYFPPNAVHPWAQLIGGGPSLKSATALTAHATTSTLDLTLTMVGSGEVALRQTLTRNA